MPSEKISELGAEANTDFSPRELEEDLVPEWRVKYFDYKVQPYL